MNFVYKHFYIYMYDNKVKYINTKNAEEYELSFDYLNLILNKAGDFQFCFNGYNLEVLRYIKHYVLPSYFYQKGIFYNLDYVKTGKYKNVLKVFIKPTYMV